MTNEEKRIEEMAKDLCSDIGVAIVIVCKRDDGTVNLASSGKYLKNLVDKGYRKTSVIAREIFAEIDEICRKYFNQCSKEPDCELMKMLQQGERFVINEMWHSFAELKKKYESEGEK